MRPAVARRAVAPRAAAVAYDDLVPSGLNGKAMEFPPKDEFPTRAEVLASIPEECFVKDTAKSLMYAAISTAMTVGCGVLAYLYIPMQLAFWPVWLAYAAVTGTIATGCWVIAHECGHNAFSDNRMIQDPWATSSTLCSWCLTSRGSDRTPCTTPAPTISPRARPTCPTSRAR